ncbi:MAG TPA: NADH-quinone oxidoreductase subunit C [Streptosporangiaceae bacterium]|jgi:Ni,Fe-hydrogenase III large subunit
MTHTEPRTDTATLWDGPLARVAAGDRFAGLSATAEPGGLTLTAHLAVPGDIIAADVHLPGPPSAYPALTPRLGAAFWYEREIHDLFGIVPAGHPRLEPLVLPLLNGERRRPRPGAAGEPGRLDPDEHALPRHVHGTGVFTIPHGPVRSGVFESVEYLVETPGEDIPHLNIRVFYKHRGVEKRFEGRAAGDAVLLAERVEGIASVAHALAFAHACEHATGSEPPYAARLLRVAHAELERLANHLDVAMKLADAAGLAVATARFGLHKERVLRLAGRMSGSRFGRGVVVPGGVRALPSLRAAEIRAELDRLAAGIPADEDALLATASFLDRLRGTGPLMPERARAHGALGPVGRASGAGEDARAARPYDAYTELGAPAPGGWDDGDTLARLRVRCAETRYALAAVRRALDDLDDLGVDPPLRAPCAPEDGRAIGWAEAPQGELVYDVRFAAGRITRCRVRSASFHNLPLFHEVFAGDILTDFPFIEAGFGLSIAGAAG